VDLELFSSTARASGFSEYHLSLYKISAVNQIIHVRYTLAILDINFYAGADTDSDHYLGRI
jgi:hypothetical protein